MSIITFNYALRDFLNNAKVISMYRASSTFNQGAENMVDDTKLSAEDESFMKKYLKLGCVKLVDVFSGYSTGLLDKNSVSLLPFEFNATYGELENQIVFRINMPSTFLPSAIDVIDETIKDGLESYIIYRTAKQRGIEFQSYQADWEDSLSSLRSCLCRRTTVITRKLNMF